MELYDIIKSSVLLFGLSLGLLVLISYVLYKIRNHAKTIRNRRLNFTKPDKRNTYSSDEKTKLQKANDEGSNFEKSTFNNNTEHHKEKYEVINKVPEVKSSLNSDFKHNPRFTKYYEETDSRMMFKLKPHNSEEE